MSFQNKLPIKLARLSFPSLFKTAVFQGESTGKYEATFLLDKTTDAKQIAHLQNAAQEFLVDKFGEGKIPKGIKLTCFADGDTKDTAGYENQIALKGSSTRRIMVLNNDKTPLAEEDNVIYAGCYVNAFIGFWYSDHPKGGKQLLCNILGVQFAKAGASFGDGVIDVTDDFDEIEDEF